MKAWTMLRWVVAVLVFAGALYYLLRPKPVLVQIAKVERGPVRETAEEEGKTRMHDHFVVAASVAGKTRRIELHAGDRVAPGQIITWIDPSPIDPRQNAVLEARLHTALAAQKQNEAVLAKATNEYEQTQRDLRRSQELWQQGIISKEANERTTVLDHAALQQLEQARASLQVARFQTEEARAALLVFRGDRVDLPTAIRSPVEGRVLRLLEQSERIVVPGTPLVEIGHAPHLEIVSDFLTREAARIRPSMPAIITDWGGDEPLHAHVRTIEPGGFTKLSALGVEEQRVNVVLDFDGATEALQDGFHVQVSVITWESESVMRIPSGAVFRVGPDWAAFVLSRGKVRLTRLKIGHRGEDFWEVLEGVTPGMDVVIHPAAELIDGASVRPG